MLVPNKTDITILPVIFLLYIFQYTSLSLSLSLHHSQTMSVKQCHYRYTFRANLASLSQSLCLTDVLVCLPSILLSPPCACPHPSARDVLGLLIRWVCLQQTIAHIPETSATTISKYPKKQHKQSCTPKKMKNIALYISVIHMDSHISPLDRWQESNSNLFAGTFSKHAIYTHNLHYSTSATMLTTCYSRAGMPLKPRENL